MISQIHPDSSIGLKKLTDADLGIGTSHQTHIGLFEETFNFIDDNHESISSQLIYSNNSYEVLAFFDYIKNPNGTYRSPKIRKGKNEELYINNKKLNSVVREIRTIANKEKDLEWYLLWFGLDTKELIFFLFNDSSHEFLELKNELRYVGKNIIFTQKHTSFDYLVKYLNSKFENLNISYFQELEQSVLSGVDKVKSRIVKAPGDLEKTRKRTKETGELGERILNEYFVIEKAKKRIYDFEWANNNNKESGEPYDFKIIRNDRKIIYVDAKSTRFDEANQPVHISANELKFIRENQEAYHIYRLYSIYDIPSMIICENIYKVAEIFLPHFELFKSSLKKEHKRLSVSGTSLSIPVDADFLNFSDGFIFPFQMNQT